MRRRGFSLLEVMVALAILTVSMILLAQTQSSAVLLTNEAEKVIVGADLARMKMTETLLLVEAKGFQQSDMNEMGDFKELGDDLLDMEFGEELEEYHWEYLVSEVDIDMLGDLASAAQGLPEMGGGDDAGAGAEGGASASANPMDALGMLGIGGDMISQFLAPYVREVRVRVWWGEDSEEAEESGNEVILVTHLINPGGAVALEQENPLQ